ncbi:hypothetical protein AN641_03205 [Candidatus Epulonipiscioides gigas]|nr:hypothetical protein AN641_03205 [Epulopiscium sp. SCG-C07WGA-EpuloA2]
MTRRLLEISKLVIPMSRVADIGTDHGIIPKYLIEKNIASFVIACDINLKPLERAKKYIGNIKNIDIRQSDGLSNIIKEDNIDTIIIAGMGGHLIKTILDKNLDIVRAAKQLILSPQNAQEKVRKYLHSIGFQIDDEIFIEDMKKYYVIMQAKIGVEAYNEESHYKYGLINIRKANGDFKEFLQYRENVITCILKKVKSNNIRYEELQKELEVLKCTKSQMLWKY